jgi:hypothetical protein
MVLGFILAVMCSFGAVLTTEMLDSKVRGVRDLRQLTGMPPIAIIPALVSESTRKRRAFAWSISVVGVSMLLVFMIAVQI